MHQLAWSPDGAYLAVVGQTGTLWVWETLRWRHAVWTWPAPASIAAVCWSPDSRHVQLFARLFDTSVPTLPAGGGLQTNSAASQSMVSCSNQLLVSRCVHHPKD